MAYGFFSFFGVILCGAVVWKQESKKLLVIETGSKIRLDYCARLCDRINVSSYNTAILGLHFTHFFHISILPGEKSPTKIKIPDWVEKCTVFTPANTAAS